MRTRALHYPWPPADMLALPPEELAAAAISSIRQVYGITLDYSRDSLVRLDALLLNNFRLGRYAPDNYPATLALCIGAYVGEVLHHHVDGGHWEATADGRPALPSLVYPTTADPLIIPAVADMMAFLWTGQGYLPVAYVDAWVTDLQRRRFEVR